MLDPFYLPFDIRLMDTEAVQKVKLSRDPIGLVRVGVMDGRVVRDCLCFEMGPGLGEGERERKREREGEGQCSPLV